MRGLLFLALIPSLMAEHVLCPNGKTTCPEELDCCEMDGQPTCCERHASATLPDTKIKTYPGMDTTEVEPATMVLSNESMSADIPLKFPYGQCSIMSCAGPCCSSTNCCPHQFGSCCSAYKCCGSFSPCCGDGCCESMSTCCGGSRCCGMLTKCCGSGIASWCCDKKYSCGKRLFTCASKGITITSEIATVLVLALGILVSRHL